VADKLVEYLVRDNIDTATRVRIARCIGTIGYPQHIDKLIAYIGDMNKYSSEILWSIFESLGILGERLGYWGNGTIFIQRTLDMYIKEGKIDANVLLKIALTLATRVIHAHHHVNNAGMAYYTSNMPSTSWEQIADSIKGRPEFLEPNPNTPRKLLNVITQFIKNNNENDQQEKIKTFGEILNNPLTKWQWVSIWDIISQLANFADSPVMDELTTQYIKKVHTAEVPVQCNGRCLNQGSDCLNGCIKDILKNHPDEYHIIVAAQWQATERKDRTRQNSPTTNSTGQVVSASSLLPTPVNVN